MLHTALYKVKRSKRIFCLARYGAAGIADCNQEVLLRRSQYDIPPYSYLKSNRQAALVLLPSDWAITNAEHLAPRMVAIGAITAAPAKALPSKLEEFTQSAGDHGVVYASLGTTAIPGQLLPVMWQCTMI
jgi:hypothetical protein